MNERQQSAPVPLSVLTGFLGSGKTTLLNRLLKDPEMAGTAVIINEFGEIGLDHLLVETADENVMEMSSGCLCCTIRGDLIDTRTDHSFGRCIGVVDEGRGFVIDRSSLHFEDVFKVPSRVFYKLGSWLGHWEPGTGPPLVGSECF